MLIAGEQFVGRERELTVFDSLLSEGKSVRVVAFWGPSGFGKSTLLKHLESSIAGWRSTFFDLEGLLVGSHKSAIAGDDLLFGLAQRLASPAGGGRRSFGVRGLRKFERRTARAIREFLSAAGTIKVVQSASFGGVVEQSHVHVDASPHSLIEARLAYRRSVVVALADLVRQQNLSRFLLFVDTTEFLRLFDDVGSGHAGLGLETPLGLTQWFLRDLVPQLLDAGPGLRIVLAGREKFDLDEPWIRQFELSEWTGDETARYLSGCGLSDPNLMDTVHAVCGGVPLWTAMVAEACLQQDVSNGKLSADWLRQTAHDRPTEQWLPEVFLARLPAVQRNIVICAALPRTLSLELTQRLLHVSDIDAPPDWWSNLCRYSFVRPARDHQPDGHRYIHRMARSAILAHLYRQEPERLLILHREAANYYARLSNFAEETYHRFASGDYELVPRWRESIQRARRHHDISAASRLLASVTAPEQIIQIRRHNRALVVEGEYQQGMIEYTQDRYGTAIECLTSALRGFQILGNQGGESRSYRWLAVLYCNIDDHQSAVDAALRALEAARQTDDIPLLGHAHSVAGQVYGTQANWRQALSHYSAALRLTRQGDAREESEALRDVHSALLAMDRRDDASRYLDLAEQVATNSKCTEELAMCLYQRGYHQILCDQAGQALDPLERSLRLTRSAGNRRDVAWCLRALAMALILTGRPAMARTCIAEAMQIFDELGDRVGQSYMQYLGAATDLSVNQQRSAEEKIRMAEMLCRGQPHQTIADWVDLLRCGINAIANDAEWSSHLRDLLNSPGRRFHAYATSFELTMIADIFLLADKPRISREYLLHALVCARRSGGILKQREIRDRLASLRAR
jgi:tetratricopeptide (TPR) repeat protein